MVVTSALVFPLIGEGLDQVVLEVEVVDVKKEDMADKVTKMECVLFSSVLMTNCSFRPRKIMLQSVNSDYNTL